MLTRQTPVVTTFQIYFAIFNHIGTQHFHTFICYEVFENDIKMMVVLHKSKLVFSKTAILFYSVETNTGVSFPYSSRVPGAYVILWLFPWGEGAGKADVQAPCSEPSSSCI